jgi:hypothetical protein
MEVCQGPNWGCSAKEKKNTSSYPTEEKRQPIMFYNIVYSV